MIDETKTKNKEQRRGGGVRGACVRACVWAHTRGGRGPFLLVCVCVAIVIGIVPFVFCVLN